MIQTKFPVLILGAGRGGLALLEMFQDNPLVEIIGIADPNPEALGLAAAKRLGIACYQNPDEAILASRQYPDCLIYNLTHDDTLAGRVSTLFPGKSITSGAEARLFWQMITHLKKIKADLETSQNQLKAIIHHAMDGIITIDVDTCILGFNPAAEKIFGYTQEEILGRHVKCLVPESLHDKYAAIAASLRDGTQKSAINKEILALRKGGEEFAAEVSISEMTLNGYRYFIGILRDITQRKAAEERIAHLAHHDYLTGLPNRALFLDRLELSLALAKRTHVLVAVLFMDLDGFKLVNDELGHDVGDHLLREVSNRLRKVVRSSDTVARMGGDEFTIILNNVGSRNDVSRLARNVIEVLSEPFDLNGHSCHVGASIGIAIYPSDACDKETLLRQADAAMYVAKRSGKSHFVFHDTLLPQPDSLAVRS